MDFIIQLSVQKAVCRNVILTTKFGVKLLNEYTINFLLGFRVNEVCDFDSVRFPKSVKINYKLVRLRNLFKYTGRKKLICLPLPFWQPLPTLIIK